MAWVWMSWDRCNDYGIVSLADSRCSKNYRLQLKGTWGDEDLKIHNHSTFLLFTWTWDHRRVKFPLLGKKETKIRRLWCGCGVEGGGLTVRTLYWVAPGVNPIPEFKCIHPVPSSSVSDAEALLGGQVRTAWSHPSKSPNLLPSPTTPWPLPWPTLIPQCLSCFPDG